MLKTLKVKILGPVNTISGWTWVVNDDHEVSVYFNDKIPFIINN